MKIRRKCHHYHYRHHSVFLERQLRSWSTRESLSFIVSSYTVSYKRCIILSKKFETADCTVERPRWSDNLLSFVNVPMSVYIRKYRYMNEAPNKANGLIRRTRKKTISSPWRHQFPPKSLVDVIVVTIFLYLALSNNIFLLTILGTFSSNRAIYVSAFILQP